jgi:hypothetical protein
MAMPLIGANRGAPDLVIVIILVKTAKTQAGGDAGTADAGRSRRSHPPLNGTNNWRRGAGLTYDDRKSIN